MSIKIVTLGEIMLRLSSPGFERIEQARSFEIYYGGAEANVAANLCNFGLDAAFVTKVPDNTVGQAAINELRSFGVDTRFVARGGERLGIYFLETGSWARPSRVIYDRVNSSFSNADIEDFDFEKIFEGVSWFHTTGITPAVSDKAIAIIEKAMKVAKDKEVIISFDMNYREKLWNKLKAREVLTRLCKYVDVYIGNIGHAELLLDINTSDANNYLEVCEKLKEKFGFSYIACTLRNSTNASINDLSALIYNGQELYKTKKYTVEIVDRVGSGDSFAAGLIYGLLNKMDFKEAAEFGIATSAFKHTIPGDLNHVSVEEVKNLVRGDTSGKVSR